MAYPSNKIVIAKDKLRLKAALTAIATPVSTMFILLYKCVLENLPVNTVVSTQQNNLLLTTLVLRSYNLEGVDCL